MGAHMPAAQVPPFPVEQEWVREINGQRFDNYLQWMQVCCAISLMPVPALSVPAGFTGEGLPIGLQILAPPFAEADALRAADAYQRRTDFHQRHPQGSLNDGPATP